MDSKNQNRKTYFYIDIEIFKKEKQNVNYLSELDNDLDLVLNSMKAMKETYKFRRIEDKRTIIFFKPDIRKRNGQLNQFCNRYLNDKLDDIIIQTGGISKVDYLDKITKFSNEKGYKILETPEVYNEEYTRSDIKHFDDKKNWMNWHKEVYIILFDEDGKLKKPDDRKIIYILDKKGKSAKSQFYK